MTIFHVFLRAAVAGAAVAPFLVAPARADIVFDFSGVCFESCSGLATGVLTLADSYSFGSGLTEANFISFDYSSSDLSFEIVSQAGQFLQGGLNADGSLFSDIPLVIEAEADVPVFDAEETEGWSAATQFSETVVTDNGASFTFTRVGNTVPEPSTWALMLIGFAGLGYAGFGRRAALARA